MVRLATPERCAILSRMRTVLLFAAVIGVGVAIGVGLKQASSDHPAAGIPAPSRPSATATQRKLAGSPPALAALHARGDTLLGSDMATFKAELAKLKGHPVVVNLWASWCGPCHAEAPIFQRVALDRGREVAFLGIDYLDSHDGAKRFFGLYPVSYPSVQDPKGKIHDALGARGAPATIYYDKRGHLTLVHDGPYDSVAALNDDIDRYAVQIKP